MENRPDRGGIEDRIAGLLAVAGVLGAVLSLVFAGLAGEPYLGSDGINGWLVVFAAGLLAALIALPFGLEARLRDRYPDHDKRWEVSLVIWGVVAVAVLVAAWIAGFDTGTLAGAAGLIAAIEAGLVIATIGTWLVSGG